MSNLNPRQWALYNFLKEQGDKWTHQEEIAKALPNFYAPTKAGDYHNTRERQLMTRDIRIINECSVIQKVIVSNPKKGIKIATEGEWEMYIKSEYKSVFSKLKRVRKKEKKGILNGQTRIVFNTERDVIEAFLKDA